MRTRINKTCITITAITNPEVYDNIVACANAANLEVKLVSDESIKVLTNNDQDKENFLAFFKGETPLPVKPVVKKAKAKKEKAPSKRELSEEIYAANSDLTRKEVIKLFMEELNMTQAGASTYYANAKNKAAEAAES